METESVLEAYAHSILELYILNEATKLNKMHHSPQILEGCPYGSRRMGYMCQME